MAALTQSQVVERQDGAIIVVPVKAATKIYEGAIVARDANGYAVPASDTAALVVLGVCDQEVDNSAGANAALSVKVRRKGAFWFANKAANPVTIASVNTTNAVIEDDNTVTVAAGATNDIPCGRVLQVDADKGVLIEF